MMDLVRKLEGLSKQLDLEGRADQARPYIPLRRADSQVLRTAAAVICKQAAEIASLKESLAAHKEASGVSRQASAKNGNGSG